MVRLLNTLRKRYTRILIDSPPSTAVTDAVALSKSADGTILVVRAGQTTREIAKNGVARFEAVGAPILGVVLNGVDTGRDSYYYYEYSYDYYGEEGEKKRRTPEEDPSKGPHSEKGRSKRSEV